MRARQQAQGVDLPAGRGCTTQSSAAHNERVPPKPPAASAHAVPTLHSMSIWVKAVGWGLLAAAHLCASASFLAVRRAVRTSTTAPSPSGEPSTMVLPSSATSIALSWSSAGPSPAGPSSHKPGTWRCWNTPESSRQQQPSVSLLNHALGVHGTPHEHALTPPDAMSLPQAAVHGLGAAACRAGHCRWSGEVVPMPPCVLPVLGSAAIRSWLQAHLRVGPGCGCCHRSCTRTGGSLGARAWPTHSRREAQTPGGCPCCRPRGRCPTAQSAIRESAGGVMDTRGLQLSRVNQRALHDWRCSSCTNLARLVAGSHQWPAGAWAERQASDSLLHHLGHIALRQLKLCQAGSTAAAAALLVRQLAACGSGCLAEHLQECGVTGTVTAAAAEWYRPLRRSGLAGSWFELDGTPPVCRSNRPDGASTSRVPDAAPCGRSSPQCVGVGPHANAALQYSQPHV